MASLAGGRRQLGRVRDQCGDRRMVHYTGLTWAVGPKRVLYIPQKGLWKNYYAKEPLSGYVGASSKQFEDSWIST